MPALLYAHPNAIRKYLEEIGPGAPNNTAVNRSGGANVSLTPSIPEGSDWLDIAVEILRKTPIISPGVDLGEGFYGTSSFLWEMGTDGGCATYQEIAAFYDAQYQRDKGAIGAVLSVGSVAALGSYPTPEALLHDELLGAGKEAIADALLGIMNGVLQYFNLPEHSSVDKRVRVRFDELDVVIGHLPGIWVNAEFDPVDPYCTGLIPTGFDISGKQRFRGAPGDVAIVYARAYNDFEDGVSEIPVVFEVASGNGEVRLKDSGATFDNKITAMTDSFGFARIEWKFGPEVGEQTLRALVDWRGYDESLKKSIEFTAEVSGDEGSHLANGATEEGFLHAGELDAWTFTARQGDYISAGMGELSEGSALYPYLRLVSPSGKLLDSKQSSGGALVAANAPETGTYTVIVASDDPGNDATGDYQISLAVSGG